MLTLHHFLTLGGILFALGLSGVFIRRNLLIILMSIELMLLGANLTLVAFAHYSGSAELVTRSQTVIVFIFVVAAAEVAVGLGLIVALNRTRRTTHTEDLRALGDRPEV